MREKISIISNYYAEEEAPPLRGWRTLGSDLDAVTTNYLKSKDRPDDCQTPKWRQHLEEEKLQSCKNQQDIWVQNFELIFLVVSETSNNTIMLIT